MTTATMEPTLVWESVPGYLPQWWSLKQLDEIAERIPYLHRRSPALAAFGLPECLFDGQPWPCRSERWRRQRQNGWLASPLRVRLDRRSLLQFAAVAMICLPLLSAGSAPETPPSQRQMNMSEPGARPLEVVDDIPSGRVQEQANLRHTRASIVHLSPLRRGERP
jgi:hypothetical protein